jgi:hypothetical protein
MDGVESLVKICVENFGDCVRSLFDGLVMRKTGRGSLGHNQVCFTYRSLVPPQPNAVLDTGHP